MNDEFIVEYGNPQDKNILMKAGYPVIALTPEDEEKKREILRKNTPSALGILLDKTFPPGATGAFLLIVLIWGTVFPFLLVLDDIFWSSIPTIANILVYGIPTLFSVIAFFYAVVIRFRPFSHRVYEAIMGLDYYPLPQSHTRGRKIIIEAHNIAKDILDSYAWKNGLADTSRDVRGEIISIFDDTMKIYNRKTREVKGHDEDFDALQKRLDSIRHYARYEMTAKSFGVETGVIDIVETVE